MADDKQNSPLTPEEQKAKDEAELIRHLLEHDSDPNRDDLTASEGLKKIDENK
jgi:hypothetical protein